MKQQEERKKVQYRKQYRNNYKRKASSNMCFIVSRDMCNWTFLFCKRLEGTLILEVAANVSGSRKILNHQDEKSRDITSQLGYQMTSWAVYLLFQPIATYFPVCSWLCWHIQWFVNTLCFLAKPPHDFVSIMNTLHLSLLALIQIDMAAMSNSSKEIACQNAEPLQALVHIFRHGLDSHFTKLSELLKFHPRFQTLLYQDSTSSDCEFQNQSRQLDFSTLRSQSHIKSTFNSNLGSCRGSYCQDVY